MTCQDGHLHSVSSQVNSQVLTSVACGASLSTHITTCGTNSYYSVIPFSLLQLCPDQASTETLPCSLCDCMYCNEKERQLRRVGTVRIQTPVLHRVMLFILAHRVKYRGENNGCEEWCLFAEVGNCFSLWKFIRILAFYLWHMPH